MRLSLLMKFKIWKRLVNINIKEITQITRTLKVLYVEDDDGARDSTLEMLQNFFKEVTTAVDGLDGIDKFNSDDFDLIISDINMPKMNGIEMLKQLDTDTPILILSAHNEAEYFMQTIKLGVEGYILKPLESQQFINVLKRVVDKILLKRYTSQYQEELKTAVEERTQELQHELHYDNLTGLRNRYSFFNDIQGVDTPTVFIIDIDKFNIINEIYTEEVGNIVLKAFSIFLLNFTKKSTYKVYRLSSDEFILWDDALDVNYEKSTQDVNSLIDKLKDFKIRNADDFISIDITVGMSIADKDAFSSAKMALEFAKKNKINHKIYTPEINKRKEDSDALEWKKRINSAIKDDRVVSVYQPIVTKDGLPLKHEALIRLREESSDKLITPFFFLDIAKKTRQYNELSVIVIFKTLNILASSNHTLSINFTYSDIKNSSLLDGIEELFINNTNIGSRAIFEITESESIENYDDVKNFIRRFRSYGVKIAIDDFGSGFSNFEYILEIEPDYLKIDGSLVKNIDTDSKAYTLVEAIVQFSHKLSIKVIAEYVHSKVVFEMLLKLDVDEYQGFYFSEPLENITNRSVNE